MTEDSEAFLVLISLGSEMPKLIEAFGLSDSDFPHGDPSIDLLYLLHTQVALLRETQALANSLQEAKDLAEIRAETDTLTGLANRRSLGQFTQRLLAMAPSARSDAFLLHVDLDRFKQINDTFGHSAGDLILQRVTSDLSQVIGPKDIAARIGGDEFVLILTEEQGLESATKVAEQLITEICAPMEFDGQLLEVGASIGITSIPSETEKSIDNFLLEADMALYDVKHGGRGAVKAFSTEMQERETFVQQLTRDIGPAVERGEFIPFFQIQVDINQASAFGLEVLGRWMHPAHGVISPARFLYVSERARLTPKIDRAIYIQALDHFVRWKASGIAPRHLSLNVTGRMLVDAGFVPWITQEVERRGIHPGEVVIELVETILIDGDSGGVGDAAEALDKAGFSLAIDDFGTGHASIASLISVPVNLVKIDRTFARNIHQSPQRAMLTKAIIDVAKQLDIAVLVEGVECVQEQQKLEKMGCTLFQGFRFGRPAPALAITEILQDQDWLIALAEERREPETLKKA
ncbi:MAG: EAL domain-containing protein [Pseudomonadota bacterium]